MKLPLRTRILGALRLQPMTFRQLQTCLTETKGEMRKQIDLLIAADEIDAAVATNQAKPLRYHYVFSLPVVRSTVGAYPLMAAGRPGRVPQRPPGH